MAVDVFIDIIDKGGLTSGSTALELNVVDVDTQVNDIYIKTATTVRIVNVLGESAKTKLLSVADVYKILQFGVLIS